jgi:hypothetical protein
MFLSFFENYKILVLWISARHLAQASGPSWVYSHSELKEKNTFYSKASYLPEADQGACAFVFIVPFVWLQIP